MDEKKTDSPEDKENKENEIFTWKNAVIVIVSAAVGIGIYKYITESNSMDTVRPEDAPV